MLNNAFKTIFSFCVCYLLMAAGSSAVAQVPTIKWQKVLGGTGNDVMTDMQVTTDKGMIITGYSTSNKSGSKTDTSYNNTYDFWIIRLDSNGNKLWDKTFGGDNIDMATAVIQTTDLGFLIGGSTISNISGNKTDTVQNRSFDYWAIKLDKNGVFKWQNSIGGNYTDKLSCLTEVSDSYVLGGISYSDKSATGEKKTDNFGSENSPDYWVARLKKTTGAFINGQIYGSTNDEFMTCIYANATGRLLGGFSYSPAKLSKKSKNYGVSDYWISRTDLTGKQIWERDYGGLYGDYMTCVSPVINGGYLLGGYSSSPVYYDKTQPSLGFSDYWIVRTDSMGLKLWDKTIGNDGGDYMQSVVQTTDKGFLLGGYSNSNAGNNKSEGTLGGYDFWIVKIDSLGNQQWDKTFGGSGADKLVAVKQLSTGEYLIGGTSNSPLSGDKTIDTVGLNDMWILRLSTSQSLKPKGTQIVSSSATVTTALAIKQPISLSQLSMTVAPNPVKNIMTVSYNAPAANKLSLQVVSSDGKVVLKASPSYGSSSYQVNAAGWSPGVYYVTLQSGSSSVMRMIIKQ